MIKHFCCEVTMFDIFVEAVDLSTKTSSPSAGVNERSCDVPPNIQPYEYTSDKHLQQGRTLYWAGLV